MTRPVAIRIAVWGGLVGAVAWLATARQSRAADTNKTDAAKTDANKTAASKGDVGKIDLKGTGLEKSDSKSSFGSGAVGENRSTGSVVSTKELSVEVTLDGGNLAFYTNKHVKTIVTTLAQLAPGDNVTITWNEKNGRKWIKKIEGQGTVEGKVIARTDLWATIKPAKGDPQQLLFPRLTPSAEELAKVDKNAQKRISQMKFGDTVQATWEITDGKRVVDVKYLAKAPARKPPHHNNNQYNHLRPYPRRPVYRGRPVGGYWGRGVGMY